MVTTCKRSFAAARSGRATSQLTKLSARSSSTSATSVYWRARITRPGSRRCWITSSARARLAEFIEQLFPLRLEVVVLAPGRAVALERDRLRPDKTVGDRWAYLDDVLRAELRDVGRWIDNGDLSVEHVVDLLLGECEVATR
jgi:hypothetical protein